MRLLLTLFAALFASSLQAQFINGSATIIRVNTVDFNDARVDYSIDIGNDTTVEIVKFEVKDGAGAVRSTISQSSQYTSSTTTPSVIIPLPAGAQNGWTVKIYYRAIPSNNQTVLAGNEKDIVQTIVREEECEDPENPEDPCPCEEEESEECEEIPN